VTDNGTYDSGDLQHATYLVENNAQGHEEDPTKPYYTPTGAAAGEQSNVMTSTSLATTDQQAIEEWMAGPFHSMGILDPSLTQVGFGSFRQSMPGEQMAAALNIIAGRGPTTTAALPVLWPGNGSSVPLLAYSGGESPDPLASCPGYSAPAGLPIVMLFGSNATTSVGAFSIFTGGHPLDSCEFDATNYSNPDGAQQSSGRALLAARAGVVILPRSPLRAGTTYSMSVAVNGMTYGWSFSTTSGGSPTAALIHPAPPPPVTHSATVRTPPRPVAATRPAPTAPPMVPAPTPPLTEPNPSSSAVPDTSYGALPPALTTRLPVPSAPAGKPWPLFAWLLLAAVLSAGTGLLVTRLRK